MNGVLAYPHFFPPPDWLKLAALCWDKIYTLREAGQQPDYVEQFQDAIPNVLEGIKVAQFSADPTVKEEFEKWVAANARDHTSSVTPFASSQSQYFMLHGLVGPNDREWFQEVLTKNGLLTKAKAAGRRVPLWEFEPRQVYAECVYSDPYTETRFLFYEAVASGDRRAAKKLLKGGLPSDLRSKLKRLLEPANAAADQYAQDVFLLPPEVPFHFLALCAAKAASSRALDLATDGEVYVGTCHYDRTQVAADVGLRLIKAFVPVDCAALDVGRLAALRADLSAKRLQFQRDVQSVCDEFAKLFSESDLRTAAGRIEDLAKQRVEEARKVYERAKVEAVLKTFGVALAPPAIMTSVASMLAIGLFTPAAIAAGVSTAIALKLVDAGKIETDKSKAAWSYILDLRGRLKPWWKFWS